MQDIGLENIALEMRRGVIVLAVLNLLQTEQYGYSVLKLLSDNGFSVDQGTLYPLLRRMESQGLLESAWRVEEARPRRYYVISSQGRKALPQLQQEWDTIVSALERIKKIDWKARMNLIDTYITQVGDNLPEKDREDIKAEIRSILEDTLESRSMTAGLPVDEAMTVEVLKEFGTPKKVAASYLPTRYLIGPRLYPTFMMVLKIILGIIGIVTIVTTSVSVAQQAQTVQSAVPIITKGLSEGIGALLSALGNIVFIFALVEWGMSRAKEEKQKEESWDPRSLEGKEDEDEFKPWERIPEIVFTLAALLIFNFYPQWIGIFINDGTSGNWVHVPFLSPAFFRYLPWLNILWLMSLALNFALLRIGKWQTWSKWFQIGIDVLTMSVFILLASGSPIVQFSQEKLAELGEIGKTIAQMQPLIQKGVYALLILIAILTGVNLVKSIIKIIRKK